MGRRSDGGFADEDGACFNGEGLGLDIADDFGARLEFDAVGGGEIAVHLAVDDDGRGFDLRLDTGVLADSEIAVGVDFTFDFTIDDKVIGEFDGAFDFNVGGKNVAGGGGTRAGSHDGGLLGTVGRLHRGRDWLRVAGFRKWRSGTVGFAVILADYFFKHGSEEWLELLGCQIVSRITVFRDPWEFLYLVREFHLAMALRWEPGFRKIQAGRGKESRKHRVAETP